MSSKKYVPQGVWLVCDKGTKPSQLRSLSYRETIIMGEHMCTRVDKMLVVNFDPFGACACSNGSPCTAPVTDWSNVTDQIRLGGNPLLLENSELPCTLGGRIKIFYTLAAASAACGASKEEEKGFWSKALDFGKGLGTGLWKGLKGTVTGVVDLVVWAGKHTTPYMLLNPAGYAEQLQKDGETLKALGNMAGKVGTWMYRNSAVNLLANPQDYMAAQAENKVMLDKLADKAANMSAEEWGDFAGQVLFEVGTEVATAGATVALTAVKAADKVVDVAKVANRLDDVTDAAKALDRADDAINAARALDKIEVPKLEIPVMKQADDIPIKPRQKTYTHGQSDGGPGTWEKRTTPKKGADYQEHVTGAPKDTEYVVKTDKMKSGEKKFDGYEPETNTLIDAKDWDKWPPEGQKWAEQKIAEEARRDLDIAKEAGCDLEYHVPNKAKRQQLEKIFRRNKIKGIKVKTTPKP